jgi:hypothetical protein
MDEVAINQGAGANLWTMVAQMVMRRPNLSLVLDRNSNKCERRHISRVRPWR